MYYREQILVEDARGQQINIGLPGRKEAPFACAAGEVIFAVGELARAAEGDEYRTTPIEALTAGSEHLLWVHRGDRAAAIAGLNVQFNHDGGTEGYVFVIIGGLLALVSILAVFMGPPP